jgi:hypothetical protein
VVFMKGTPQAPSCGFSRAVVQILDVQVSRITFPTFSKGDMDIVGLEIVLILPREFQSRR